jgi:hypothetical protein
MRQKKLNKFTKLYGNKEKKVFLLLTHIYKEAMVNHGQTFISFIKEGKVECLKEFIVVFQLYMKLNGTQFGPLLFLLQPSTKALYSRLPEIFIFTKLVHLGDKTQVFQKIN